MKQKKRRLEEKGLNKEEGSRKVKENYKRH